MDNHDNGSQEDSPIRVADTILLGLVRDEERESFVSTMTDGVYSEAGDLKSIGVVPGVLSDGRAGLYLSFAFTGANGAVERVEVGRVTYGDLVACMASIVRCLHDADLLKYESGGAHMQHLLDTELRSKTTSH